VGLYCEAQQAGYCALHALNAMASAPNTHILLPCTSSTTQQSPSLPPVSPEIVSDTGWYSFEAVNKLLYYTTTVDIALKVIVKITPAISMDMARTQTTSQSYILSRAPPHCTALYIHAPGHFKCWKKSPLNGQWYELDSITYATSHSIKALAPPDLDNLHDCTISTTVQADAYLSNTTGMPLCKHRRQAAIGILPPPPIPGPSHSPTPHWTYTQA
jgi:hypothetical protein